MRPFTLIVLALTVWLAAGCGAKLDGKIQVSIWHQKSGPERDLFVQLIGRFMQENPDVAVEALYREPEELRNLYIIAAVAGKGPDLVNGAADNVGVFELTKTIQPVDGILDAAFLEGFIPEGIVRWNGHPWLVADQLGNQLALVCNDAKMTRAPATLDELISMSQELTKDLDGDGKTDVYGLNWNYREPYFFIPFLTAFGGWVMDETGHPTLDTPETVAALQFILDLRDKYQVIPKEGDYEIAEMLYKEGRTAMIINGPWAWAGYGVGVAGRSTAHPLPVNSATGIPAASMVAAKGYSVNVNVGPEKKEAVGRLLRFLTGSEVQAVMAREVLTYPVRRDVVESEVVLGNPTLLASRKMIAHSRPIPIQPQMRQIWDGMRGPYQLVMSGAVTAQEGARLMQRECEKKIADSNL